MIKQDILFKLLDNTIKMHSESDVRKKISSMSEEDIKEVVVKYIVGRCSICDKHAYIYNETI